tara:strand:+ start:100 stop:966 length:867 start_codon:yes stop_codon:yes gene_type:complete
MAVKQITNNYSVNKENVNRGEQRSTKNINTRGGNSALTIAPGSNATKNYSVTLKDIDTAIISHIKDVMKPTIREASENVKVPVMYGNEERWVAVRKRGTLRDKNNKLILPLIMLKRTDLSKNNLSGQAFDHDIKGKYAQVVRNSSWSKTNRYDRFAVQTGVSPVYENVVTGMPDFTDVTYNFVIWTAYIEQMNGIVESFVAQSNTYWGSTTDMKFLSSIDTISDATEMNVDSDRIIKQEFSLIAKAALLPEYTNSTITSTVSNLKKQLSPAKISFGYEGDASDNEVKK